MAPTIEAPEVGLQIIIALIAGVIALVASFYFKHAVYTQPIDVWPEGKEDLVKDPKATMTELERLRKLINNGAIQFLYTEYKYLAGFVVIVSAAVCGILYSAEDPAAGVWTAINILVGAGLSAAAGFAGMLIATSANSRTTIACVKSMSEGLKVSFASGAVMSNTVVGLGILGLSIMYGIFEGSSITGNDYVEWRYLSGFGFGASCIALFARVGGGVFTKAADVGADLVGKVEQGIPEDDPRNPAVVADNVGDNVGDVAGMGADLFESYVGSIIATATLANGDANKIALPFWVAGFGIIMSMFGVVAVRATKLSDDARLSKLLGVIRRGVAIAGVLSLVGALVACMLLLETEEGWKIWGCIVIGLAAGEIVGKFTEYCTSYEEAPTRDISAASEYGAAPVVIKGLGVGMLSTLVPTLTLSATVVACNEIAGLYGVAISGVGLLATLGMTLATDAYGPVADNAGGLAEMAGLPDGIRDVTDALDSLGNTTAATGKGFAIGSAVLTSVGLIAAFMEEANLSTAQVSLREPAVLVGVLIGAMLPFLFAALTMLSVDSSARAIISEVRLQFAKCPKLMQRPGQSDDEYDAAFKEAQVQDQTSEHFGKLVGSDGLYYPDSDRCVDIATSSAIHEMMLPGTMAVFSPIIVGFLLGAPALAGMLAGSLSSGFMMALTMSNAGGAWDNAKKWVEKCGSEGEPTADGGITWKTFGVKKAKLAKEILSNAATAAQICDAEDMPDDEAGIAALAERMSALYKARKDPVVSGDTVGDPFKDTSGPALNILIKLMSIVSLVLAPTFKNFQTSFDPTGWWVAVLILVIVGAICAFAMKRFAASDKARDDAAALEFKAAQEASYKAAAGGAASGAGAAGAGGEGDVEMTDMSAGEAAAVAPEEVEAEVEAEAEAAEGGAEEAAEGAAEAAEAAEEPAADAAGAE